MNGQIRFMKEVVPWLEQEDIIEKYAWFSTWALRKSGLTQVEPGEDVKTCGAFYHSIHGTMIARAASFLVIVANSDPR